MTNTKVEKIVLNGDQAVGVQTVPAKPLHPKQHQEPKIYKARKQIIVSGGTLSSPLILQRSGIGNAYYVRPSPTQNLLTVRYDR